MKCKENGECPFLTVRAYLVDNQNKSVNYCKRGLFEVECGYELQYGRCHLLPGFFPIIRAMIAGEVRTGNVSPFTIYENGKPVNGEWKPLHLWVCERLKEE